MADADPPSQENSPNNSPTEAVDPFHEAIGKSIKAHRLLRGWKLGDVAEKIGMDNGNLSRLERGKHTLTTDRMQSLAKLFDIPITELFENPLGDDWDGTPPKVISPPHKTSSQPSAAAKIRPIKSYKTLADIPVAAVVLIDGVKSLPNVADNQPNWNIDSEMPIQIPGMTLRNLRSKPGDLAALSVDNDAMAPRLYQNDVVVIDVSDQLVPSTGGVFAVVFPGQPVELRWLASTIDGGLTISCDNKQYPPIELDRAERNRIQIIGRAKVSYGSGGL